MAEEFTNDSFQVLLEEFCASTQIPMDERALGIAFEADGHRALIAPDPRDERRLLVEVRVMALSEPSANLLMALHQINHQCLLEHDWVASVNVADHLSLHTQRDIHTCRSEDLQTLLAEGVERAQALQKLCEVLAEQPAPADAFLPDPPGDQGVMIRG